jgi:DNA-binding CsgD family transcriptional regulator
VSTHLRRMFAKFDVRSRAALIARLLEEELVLDDRRLFPR